jgi:hypothetical protein
MYQWRLMNSDNEIEYGRRTAEQLNLPFIRDINLKELDIEHPTIHLDNSDELHIDLGTSSDKAILLLKQNNKKSFFEFGNLMYCKLYPRYKGNQDVIVVMDLYYANIME